MTTNPFLKKSKPYVKNLIVFSAICAAVLLALTAIVLALLDIILLNEITVNIIFALLGFLLSTGKAVYEKIKDSSPWETYLNYLVKKENLSDETNIRISYAAFLLIELNGQYLLLKNRHGINLFQLPSWTYEVPDEETLQKIEHGLGASRDQFIKREYNDYRFLVPVKNLKKFYKYFCEKVNPYQYSCAKIVQNMVERCSLAPEIFSDITTFFKWRKIRKIQYSRYTSKYEMNVCDIYVFCANEAQKNALKESTSISSDAFKWVSIDQIKANGVDKEMGDLYADIAPFTYEILTENTEGWSTVKNDEFEHFFNDTHHLIATSKQ